MCVERSKVYLHCELVKLQVNVREFLAESVAGECELEIRVGLEGDGETLDVGEVNGAQIARHAIVQLHLPTRVELCDAASVRTVDGGTA